MTHLDLIQWTKGASVVAGAMCMGTSFDCGARITFHEMTHPRSIPVSNGARSGIGFGALRGDLR